MPAGFIVLAIGALVADDFLLHGVIDHVQMVTEQRSLALLRKKAETDSVAFIQTFPVEQVAFLQRDDCLAEIPGVYFVW